MPFINELDKDILRSYGILLEYDLPVFIIELYNYLKFMWCDEFHKDLEPLKDNDIETFNKNINYPSREGFIIICDSFPNVTPKLGEPYLCKKSKYILGHFYGVWLS